jgi:hypothetical protein
MDSEGIITVMPKVFLNNFGGGESECLLPS